MRTASCPDPPGSSRRPVKGLNDVGSSRTPLHHAHRARTIWQYWHVPASSGLLTPSPNITRIRLPSASPTCCDRPKAKVSHLRSNLRVIMAAQPPMPMRQRSLGALRTGRCDHSRSNRESHVSLSTSHLSNRQDPTPFRGNPQSSAPRSRARSVGRATSRPCAPWRVQPPAAQRAVVGKPDPRAVRDVPRAHGFRLFRVRRRTLPKRLVSLVVAQQ
jgi:hypothetical protein